MKKLKKLSLNHKPINKTNNKEDFKVIVIYGAPAVGKFTVAKELQKSINFKVFHNHSVKDIVWEFFERGTHSSDVLFEEIIFSFFKQIADNHTNTILTNTHSANFVSSTGLTNIGLYKKIEKIIKKKGGKMFYIQLISSPEIILKRTVHFHRKKYKKLTDDKIMNQVLKEKDWVTPANLKNQVIIDNTKLSPKKVVDIIIKHFKLNGN